MISQEKIYEHLLSNAQRAELGQALTTYQRLYPETFELVIHWKKVISQRKKEHLPFTQKEIQLIALQLYLLIQTKNY